MGLPTGIFWLTGHQLIAARAHTLSFQLTWTTQAVLALVAGILVLIRPKNLNIIIAAYLLLLGLLGIVNISF